MFLQTVDNCVQTYKYRQPGLVTAFLLFYYDRGQKGPDLPTYLAWNHSVWVFCFLFVLSFVARATHPPSEPYIFCEIDLFSSYRPPDTTKMIEISSRIHFWDLEGPKWPKMDLKQRFSIKSWFSWRSAPRRILSIYRRPGLGPGPRPFLYSLYFYMPGLGLGPRPFLYSLNFYMPGLGPGPRPFSFVASGSKGPPTYL